MLEMPDTSELFHSKIMKDVLNKYLENCLHTFKGCKYFH